MDELRNENANSILQCTNSGTIPDNLEIINNKDLMSNIYQNHNRNNYVYNKHNAMDNTKQQLYINQSSNVREITLVPDATIRITPLICHDGNTYDNKIINGDFINRNNEFKIQDNFMNSKQNNNIEYPVMMNTLTNQDTKLLNNFNTRDFGMIESQFVLDRQQLIPQNIYTNIPSVTHFQQQPQKMTNENQQHSVLYQTKQLDYRQDDVNHVLLQQKQLSDIVLSTYSDKNDDAMKNNTNFEGNLMKIDSTNYGSNPNIKSTIADNYSVTMEQQMNKSENTNNKITNKVNKQYHCTVCNITYNKVTQLNAHKKDVHLSEESKTADKNKSNKTFSCTQCAFTTKYSSALKRHKDVHMSNRIFECPTCGKTYNQLFNLKTHQRIHAGLKVYNCEECDFITPYHYSLKRHKIFHTGEKAFSCFVCNKKFSAAPDLKRHIRSHTGQRPYLCNLCGRLFRQTGHLKFHRSKHHPEHVEDQNKTKPVYKIRINIPNPLSNNSNLSNDMNLIEINSANPPVNVSQILAKNKINIYSSDNVKKVKMAKSSTMLNTATPKESLKVNVSENVNQVVTYIKPQKAIETKKIFNCQLCNQNFKSSRDLTVHDKIHQGEKSFRCELCDFVTLHPSSLRKHKRSHLLRKYGCVKCNASFTTEERLNIHTKSHDLNKKYSCDQCNFVSSYASALNRHKLTHNVEKPFKCDVCDESFAQEFHLNSHKRLHSGKKVYKCDECSFVTPYHYSLKRHKISHSGIRPYPCTFCDAAFAGAEDLKRHIRAHLGEKPFFCNICGRLFSQAAHVKNHKKKHFVNPEVKKMKKCLECGETFADLSSLRQHKNTQHKQNKIISNKEPD